MARRKKKAAIKIKLKPTEPASKANQTDNMGNLKKPKQTKAERLEKKRIAERKRLEKIRNDPVRYEEFKEKQRKSYHKRKAEKKILPVSEMTPKVRKTIRKRNRDNFKRFYYRKKERARLEVILQENSPPESDVEVLEPQPLMENQNLNSPGPSLSCRETPIPRAFRPNFDHLRNMSPISTASRCSSVSTSASTSVRKSLLRYKYQTNKYITALEKRVNKLKQIKDAYRKRYQRLQKAKYRLSCNITKDKSIIANISKRRSHTYCTEISALKKQVTRFFEDDEVSRVCPGKKEYITRGKEKMQKRYLNDSMKNLYERYKADPAHPTISYPTFCRLRPFWVRIPNVNERETCLCKLHANVGLLVTALKRRNIISENSCTDVCRSLCCEFNNVQCLLRKCAQCQNKNLNVKEFDDSQPITYWQWQAKPKTIDKRGVDTKIVVTEKVRHTTNPRSALDELDKLLRPFSQHCGNIVNQSAEVKNIKNNLSKEECILHIDFSENYSAKFAQEIQSVHFGGNRSQITLHTAMLYYFDENCDDEYQTQSFCTLSTCLRHDAAAIWAHLIPLLKFIEERAPQVKVFHFVSDSPSSQYRNKKTFYIMAKLHWHFINLEKLTWNYTESGHGKSAADGIGGILKRTADQVVAYGKDISNLEDLIQNLRSRCPGVKTEIVDDYTIYEKDLLMPDLNIQPFRGTMKIHQVVWNKEHGDRLAMRMLTCTKKECFLNAAAKCSHGNHIGFHVVEKRTDTMTTPKSNVRSATTKSLITFPIAATFKRGRAKKQSIQIISQKIIKPPTERISVQNEDYLDTKRNPEDYATIEENNILNDNICLNTPTTSEIGSLSKYWNDNETLTLTDIADENLDDTLTNLSGRNEQLNFEDLVSEALSGEDLECLVPYSRTELNKDLGSVDNDILPVLPESSTDVSITQKREENLTNSGQAIDFSIKHKSHEMFSQDMETYQNDKNNAPCCSHSLSVTAEKTTFTSNSNRAEHLKRKSYLIHNYMRLKELPLKDITITKKSDAATISSLSSSVTEKEPSTLPVDLTKVKPAFHSVYDDENNDPTENTRRGPIIGDFILAKFTTNKGKKTFKYVCRIKEVHDDEKVLIQGFKSVKKKKTVYRAIPKDISIIDLAEIERILPLPRETEHDTYIFPNDIEVKEI